MLPAATHSKLGVYLPRSVASVTLNFNYPPRLLPPTVCFPLPWPSTSLLPERHPDHSGVVLFFSRSDRPLPTLFLCTPEVGISFTSDFFRSDFCTACFVDFCALWRGDYRDWPCLPSMACYDDEWSATMQCITHLHSCRGRVVLWMFLRDFPSKFNSHPNLDDCNIKEQFTRTRTKPDSALCLFNFYGANGYPITGNTFFRWMAIGSAAAGPQHHTDLTPPLGSQLFGQAKSLNE